MSLSVLAATSTDRMIRRLGGCRGRRVHQSVYVIAVLALVHYFIQSKLNVAEPTVIAGLFVWLMAHRAIVWIWGEDRASSWPLISLSITAGLLTAIGEATYYRLANGFDPWRILAANVSWHFDRRARLDCSRNLLGTDDGKSFSSRTRNSIEPIANDA